MMTVDPTDSAGFEVLLGARSDPTSIARAAVARSRKRAGTSVASESFVNVCVNQVCAE